MIERFQQEDQRGPGRGRHRALLALLRAMALASVLVSGMGLESSICDPRWIGRVIERPEPNGKRVFVYTMKSGRSEEEYLKKDLKAGVGFNENGSHSLTQTTG